MQRWVVLRASNLASKATLPSFIQSQGFNIFNYQKKVQGEHTCPNPLAP